MTPDPAAPALAELTTLRVGGPASAVVVAHTEAELIDAVRSADAAGTPLLVLGGGSNLVVSDDGFDGVVVRDARLSAEAVDDSSCGGVSLTVAAGTPWDDVVALAVERGWVGIEALSGIPGSAGATPVQNVGAYGQEVSQTVASVRVWDREESRVRTLVSIECGFGYRDSLLKRSIADAAAAWGPTPRYVVLEVTLQLPHGSMSAPVRYAQLAEHLGIDLGDRAALGAVRAAVLDLRAAKGMVLDAADHDTWSAGSFFTNPVLGARDAAALPADAPRYPAGSGAADDAVKTSAAWLIERAGFARGFALPGSRAALSRRHTLAITNRGGATAREIVELARHLRDGVADRFGVRLVPEPVLVGVAL